MFMLTLADELVLLAITEKGDVASSADIRLDHAIAGAHLMELALAGRVKLEDGETVVIADRAPTGDPPTDELLSAIGSAAPPRSAQEWITEQAGAGARTPVLAGLHERGTLSEQKGRVLGVFRRTRHVETDPEPEREVRSRLRGAVLGPPGEVDSRTAALASLVAACHLASEVFPQEEERAQAEHRLEEFARGDVLRGALGEANDAMVATMMVAVSAATSASVASMAAVVVVNGL